MSCVWASLHEALKWHKKFSIGSKFKYFFWLVKCLKLFCQWHLLKQIIRKKPSDVSWWCMSLSVETCVNVKIPSLCLVLLFFNSHNKYSLGYWYCSMGKPRGRLSGAFCVGANCKFLLLLQNCEISNVDTSFWKLPQWSSLSQ